MLEHCDGRGKKRQRAEKAARADCPYQVAANEQRSAKETRALILIKAEDLSLPVQGDGIQIEWLWTDVESGCALQGRHQHANRKSALISNQVPTRQLKMRAGSRRGEFQNFFVSEP